RGGNSRRQLEEATRGGNSRRQLEEQHRIDRHDARCAASDTAACASKTLFYTVARSVTRQAFIHPQRVIASDDLARAFQARVACPALPATGVQWVVRPVAQWVVRHVALAWTSYCAACAAWEAAPPRFLGHPNLPHSRDKRGHIVVTSTEQAISRAPPQRGFVV